MKFQQKQVALKNGKNVLIREAEIEDTEQIFETISKYISDSQYIPKLNYEIVENTEQRVNWVNSFINNENSLLLVAEYENEIIGNIDITGSNRKIMQHTAVIGMGMLMEYRNIGLGFALLESCIDWAKNNSFLELLWLQVYTANSSGINLYKKIGFKECGTIDNFFKQDGKYYHNLTMSLKIK